MSAPVPAHSRQVSASLVALVAAALAIGSCTGDAVPGTSVDVPKTSTSTPRPSTTFESVPAGTHPDGLDLGLSEWVINGPDGLRTDEGDLIWPSGALFEKAVARDRAGGLVFIDESGLWWYKAGTSEPVNVASDVPTRIAEVIRGDTGMIASLGYGERTYVSLRDGMAVEDPSGDMVIVDPQGKEVWSAGNGWSLWIEGPDLAPVEEGTPIVVESPARLLIANAHGLIVVDEVVGTDSEPWVRIHDFDGQVLILSRGPLEPAMPEETFLVIDLSCDTCTSAFVASATSASLVGPDRDWNGPVEFSVASLSYDN